MFDQIDFIHHCGCLGEKVLYMYCILVVQCFGTVDNDKVICCHDVFRCVLFVFSFCLQVLGCIP